MIQYKHIIFYDGECGLCNRAVRFILNADRKKIFAFAPLQGQTAQKELDALYKKKGSIDSLVLLENYGSDKQELLIEAKGFLRILWLLGGEYTLLGSFSFLPSFFMDMAYRLVARHRHSWKIQKTPLEGTEDRMLP